jgi:hypothetical protein
MIDPPNGLTTRFSFKKTKSYSEDLLEPLCSLLPETVGGGGSREFLGGVLGLYPFSKLFFLG